MNKRLILDFETRSELDIEVGAWNYSRHPSTRALCVACTNEDGNVSVYDLLRNPRWPKEWEIAVNEGWEIHAWGSFFEYCIVTHVLKDWPQPHPELWRDTQTKALSCGFPAKLGMAAEAMRLPMEKDKRGVSLINYWSKPITNGQNKGQFRTPERDDERWAALLAYCKQDVVVQQLIDKTLPDLTEHELAFTLATADMNRRGIYIDTALVRGLKQMAADGKAAIFKTLDGLDFAPEDLTNHAKVLAYVQNQGVTIDSVAKARVKEALQLDLPGSARSVLEARQASGKTSVAKLDTLLLQVGDDSRLRDMTRANGTTTGRDSSVGMNLQNLPRGEKMDVDALVSAALSGDSRAFVAAAVVKGKPDPLGGVVSCIRACFAAQPGRTLHQCDYSAVEPRIGAWLVGDKRMLAAFDRIDNEGGVDIYQIEAASFFGCDPSEVTGERRQFGKVYTLACQYQAGEATIQRFAKDQYGVVLTLEQAALCKNHWRQQHPLWVNHWYDVQRAALWAIANPNRVMQCGKSAWCYDGKHLKVRMPSGRIVWFPWAEVDESEGKPGVTYMFVHPLTKQWVRGKTYGGALANLLTQGTGACLLRHAVCNLRRRGMDVVMRVHDEIVLESAGEAPNFKATMLESPPWAEGLRLNGAGWSGQRYCKA